MSISSAPQEQSLPFTHSSRELAQYIRSSHELLTQPESIAVIVGRHAIRPQNSVDNRITLKRLAGNVVGLDILVGALTSNRPSVDAFLERFSEQELRYGLALGVQEKILEIIDTVVEPNFSSNASAELAFYQGVQRMLIQRATPTPQQMRR